MYLCAKMITRVFSCFACMCVIPKHMECPMLERPQTRTLQNIRTERRLGDLPHAIVHVRTWRPASQPECVCVHVRVCPSWGWDAWGGLSGRQALPVWYRGRLTTALSPYETRFPKGRSNGAPPGPSHTRLPGGSRVSARGLHKCRAQRCGQMFCLFLEPDGG